ncbi:MAG: hypothetical protein V1755_11710 [Chloroflexota bacterium]
MTHAQRCILLLLVAGSACQAPASTLPGTEALQPSPVPSSTPTPSPSPVPPSPTATLAPAARSFRAEFDGGAPYWIFLQAAAGREALHADAASGSLRLTLSAPNQWAYALYDAHAYADVRVDARVELGAGGQGSAGLICRYDPLAGWYEFNIYADQTYTLLFGQWLAEGVARYTPLVIASSEKIAPAVNEIGLGCEGDILTPYINGVQIRRRQEKLHILHEGKIGISAASFENAPLSISVDWFGVIEP